MGFLCQPACNPTLILLAIRQIPHNLKKKWLQKGVKHLSGRLHTGPNSLLVALYPLIFWLVLISHQMEYTVFPRMCKWNDQGSKTIGSAFVSIFLTRLFPSALPVNLKKFLEVTRVPQSSKTHTVFHATPDGLYWFTSSLRLVSVFGYCLHVYGMDCAI